MTDDKEQRILRMFEKSSAKAEDLFETSYVNHIAWSIAILALGLVIWLSIALVRAENHRYAMERGMCQDPVFKGKMDDACMKTVRSRDYWFQHLWYGVTHVK